MRNGPRTMMNTRQPRSAAPFRSKQWQPNSRGDRPNGSQNAQASYARYMALAEAQVRAGDIVGAENYYQHAEHYLRTMSSNQAQ